MFTEHNEKVPLSRDLDFSLLLTNPIMTSYFAAAILNPTDSLCSLMNPLTVLTFPVRLIESGAKTFNDLTRALIDGIFAIGSQVGNSVGVGK